MPIESVATKPSTAVGTSARAASGRGERWPAEGSTDPDPREAGPGAVRRSAGAISALPHLNLRLFPASGGEWKRHRGEM